MTQPAIVDIAVGRRPRPEHPNVGDDQPSPKTELTKTEKRDGVSRGTEVLSDPVPVSFFRGRFLSMECWAGWVVLYRSTLTSRSRIVLIGWWVGLWMFPIHRIINLYRTRSGAEQIDDSSLVGWWVGLWMFQIHRIRISFFVLSITGKWGVVSHRPSQGSGGWYHIVHHRESRGGFISAIT